MRVERTTVAGFPCNIFYLNGYIVCSDGIRCDNIEVHIQERESEYSVVVCCKTGSSDISRAARYTISRSDIQGFQLGGCVEIGLVMLVVVCSVSRVSIPRIDAVFLDAVSKVVPDVWNCTDVDDIDDIIIKKVAALAKLFNIDKERGKQI